MNNITRRFFAITVLGLAAAGSAQAWSWSFGGSQHVEGGGDITTDRRDLGAFDAVALASSFKVVVRQGSADKVEIRTDSNLHPYLEIRVVESSKGRTLEIGARRGFQLSSRTTPTITLEMRQLRGVSINGSGEIRVEAMKTTGSVDASIAGSGDIRFNGLEAERIGLRVSGSGDIVANGKATTLTVNVAGSGDVKARELVVEDAKVSIAGSGDVSVQARKRLDVNIVGSGDVGYLGNPEISMSNAGSGSVRRLKD
ncbi:Putative auto-transporter adhesin, head GIN domain [Roseateles sp. YR242]|uniref:head GIN domain-containing protein n=1 Tax=Roseateles sp. YR242 TaxID=1855305 RepID=UPI0008C5869D|nr:head GIN domain-containing protein [Roseateles sp. YR242]SEL50215.1 Putative auto-transporter adhesin, head GIN domain [Roseateles sp. YR242]